MRVICSNTVLAGSHAEVFLWVQAVEAAAASGEFVYQSDIESVPQPIVSIGQYTVILPTMTPIHGQDTWGAMHVSDQYGDHTAWDAETIVEMLTKFFAVTKALSFASLEEYAWRLDKVQDMRLRF